MKKIISLVLTLLLLISTVYIPAFAFNAEITLPEDVIKFNDEEIVICDENFEKGVVGTELPGIGHMPYQRDNASLSKSPNYLSMTYANGIGSI